MNLKRTAEKLKELAEQQRRGVGDELEQKADLITTVLIPISRKERGELTAEDIRKAMEILCYGNIGFCVPAGTPILMGDLSWKPIEMIREGDNVVGVSISPQKEKRLFDANKKTERPEEYSKLTKVRVLATMKRKSKTILIKTDKGELEVTPEHPLFGSTPRRNQQFWRRARSFKSGDWIRFMPNSKPRLNNDYIKGWLTGYVEGDGCFYNRSYPPLKISLSERSERIEKYKRAMLLRREGLNAPQISKEIGISEDTIYGWIYGNRPRQPIVRMEQKQFKIASVDEELLDAISERASKFRITLIPAKCFVNKNNPFSSKEYLSGRAIYKHKEAEKFKQICHYDTNGSLDYHRGYLGGIFDSEGGFSTTEIRIYQRKQEVVSHIKTSATNCGFTFKQYERKDEFLLDGGIKEQFRFLVETRPVLKRKVEGIFRFTMSGLPKARIVGIFPMSEKEVFNIETETGNYVANGFIVHNCCGLEKPCVFRDAVKTALKISDAEFKSKESWVFSLILEKSK